MRSLKLKVCGMVHEHNILEVGSLNLDFMGFIFYKESLRYVGEDFQMPSRLGGNIKKVGVFVNGSLSEVLNKVRRHNLDFVQLHGNESVDFCRKLKEERVGIIKAFFVDNQFDFKQVFPFEDAVDYFLFDTKGKLPGGNGVSFDWALLNQYKGKVLFFLSGGINLTNASGALNLNHPMLYALDVNSGVEINPGMKDKKKVEDVFIKISGI